MKLLFVFFITAVLLNGVEPTLSDSLKSNNLTVNDESFLKTQTELISLIIDTESMDKDEKQYWLHQLPNLADEQISRLLNILRTEKEKLANLEEDHQEELHQLDIKHAKEWIEKLDEIITTPNAPKPEKEFLLLGVERIDFYLSNAKADDNLLGKMLTITDTLLLDHNLSLQNRAKTELSVYNIYEMYGNFRYLKEKQKHINLAISAFKQINLLEEDLEDDMIGRLLVRLSYINLCLGDFEGTIKAADESLLFYPDAAHIVMVNKAHALIFLGKIKEAKALYEKSLTDLRKEEIIKGIGEDIDDFKTLKLPATGIGHIEAIWKMMK
jgi:tetratricopeptide (TPR) repeat protein